jgi:SAM-dependent methyltransferase
MANAFGFSGDRPHFGLLDMEYNREFFEVRQDLARQSAERATAWLMELLSPCSVIDVGCGTAGWLAAFRRRGVSEILGLDGDWVPRDQLEISADEFRAVDLHGSLGITRRFDLAICLEVAEHISAPAGDTLVRSLAGAAPLVLFSAAVPHQGGTGHINEQWPEYWIERFEREGMIAIDCFRPQFWNDSQMAWWYAQNAIIFVSPDASGWLAKLRAQEAKGSMGGRALVHPRMLESILAQMGSPMSHSLGQVLGALPALVSRSVSERLARISKS